MNTKITNTATLSLNANKFVGEFTGKRNEQGMAEVAVKKQILAWWWSGNDDPARQTSPLRLKKMLNRKNENVEAALGDGHFVFLDVPQDIQLDYALLMRNLVNTNTRNPHN